MKRTLITAAALYLLHRRQKAMEIRLQEQTADATREEGAR